MEKLSTAKQQSAAPQAANARLAEVIDRFGTLAGAAFTAGQLLANASSPEADFKHLRRLIEADPGLTLRVLRIANSAFYGQTRKVGSIDRAVAVLGADGVRMIAAAACLDHALPNTVATRSLSAGLQRHSLCCAVSARIVARSRSAAAAGDAFIAGLLHDIGCGLLMLVDCERYGEFTARRLAAARMLASLDLEFELHEERRVFGITQREATLMIANLWKLPEWFTASIALAHEQDSLTADASIAQLADSVRWAERMAPDLGYPNDFQSGMLPEGEPKQPLPADLRQDLMDAAPAEIDELRGALAF